MTPLECRSRRLALGASQWSLAQRAGVVELTVRRFEEGLAQPRPVTVVALTKALRALEADS